MPQETAAENAPVQVYRRTVSAGRPDDGTLNELRQDVQQLRAMMSRVVERSGVDQKVFDSLHSELREYKNDFFYERLKPIVRPLLFLYDSIQQFENEYNEKAKDENTALATGENLAYFRDQVQEILTICEVTPIEETRGQFDPAIHKAVEMVPVAPEHDNTIQRVVRTGWYLNGTLLRPVEVVRGKAQK